MAAADLIQVINLYKDANQFAKKTDIKKWTTDGLKKYPAYNLVYEENGKILGAISAVQLKKNAIEINDIAVLKLDRNKQIGSKLMHAFFQAIIGIPIKKVSLWVHWKNAAAIPFYYKFGFKIHKYIQTKNISGVPNGEDVICLEKIL